MATAMMSTDIGESRAIESMLGIAVSRLRDSYVSIINDSNSDKRSLLTENPVPLSAIEMWFKDKTYDLVIKNAAR